MPVKDGGHVVGVEADLEALRQLAVRPVHFCTRTPRNTKAHKHTLTDSEKERERETHAYKHKTTYTAAHTHKCKPAQTHTTSHTRKHTHTHHMLEVLWREETRGTHLCYWAPEAAHCAA